MWMTRLAYVLILYTNVILTWYAPNLLFFLGKSPNLQTHSKYFIHMLQSISHTYFKNNQNTRLESHFFSSCTITNNLPTQIM